MRDPLYSYLRRSICGIAVTSASLLLLGCGTTDSPSAGAHARYAPAGEHDAADYEEGGDSAVDLQAVMNADPSVKQKMGNFVEVPAENLPNYRIMVVQKNRFGYMNLEEQVVIPCQYVDAKPFSEGLACVKKKDKWGYIDHTGAYVIKPIYDEAKPFKEGQAEVTVGDQYGFIDPQGGWAYGPFLKRKFLTQGEGLEDEAPEPKR